MSSTSALEAIVRDKISDINDDIVMEVLERFKELGVTSVGDLKHARLESLYPKPLTEVQARKLLQDFPGQVTEREVFNLKEKHEHVAMLEQRRKIDDQRMEVNKSIDKQVDGVHERASEQVKTENKVIVGGASAIGAGVGSVVGALAGPVGAMAGAVIGGAIGGGIAAVTAAVTGGKRMEVKKETYDKQDDQQNHWREVNADLKDDRKELASITGEAQSKILMENSD